MWLSPNEVCMQTTFILEFVIVAVLYKNVKNPIFEASDIFVSFLPSTFELRLHIFSGTQKQ